MPDYVLEALEGAGLKETYDERPPYQRNDYIGWITRAKLEETRQRRVQQMLDELAQGDVYMRMDWNPPKKRRGEGTDTA
jgi:uncharacterized protein YdeI (YjbR/CyaY-like superfamily)